MIHEIIRKSLDGAILTKEEISLLYEVCLFSEESAMIIAASRRKSETASNGLAEVHAQVGLNIAPCPKNCAFCAFAARNKVFQKKSKFLLMKLFRRQNSLKLMERTLCSS